MHAEAEPALTLFADKSPLYAADMSDDDWKSAVEELAAHLAARFEPFKVYVSHIPPDL